MLSPKDTTADVGLESEELLLSMHGIRIYENGVAMKDSTAPLTLSEAIDIYITSQSDIVSPHTVKTYRSVAKHLLRHFSPDVDVTTLTKRDMVGWRSYLTRVEKFDGHDRINGPRGKLSAFTIRRLMGTASSMFNWLVEYELMLRNPLKGVRRPVAPRQEPSAISQDDFQKLLEAAGTYIGNYRQIAHVYEARDTALIMFLASSGCRVGGLCDAQLKNLTIYEDGAQIILKEKGRGGGKMNTYSLSDIATAALMEWLEVRPETDHDYIFTVLWGRTKDKPIKPQTVSQLLRRLEKQTGVKIANNHPHAFRHALAVAMLDNGADLATVRDTLNHSDIRVTSRYARWNKQALRRKKQKFGYT